MGPLYRPTALRPYLILLAAARLLFHVWYVPAWEGPDEPFHLARARNAATLPDDIAASVRAHPFAPDLQRLPASGPIRNYEAHQPPLYYLTGRLFLWSSDPLQQLYAMRMYSALLVIAALALCGPRAMWLALLVPGAAESLARCANDAGVFAWCAIAMWAVARRKPTGVLALIALAGPLIKLTSLPVVAFLIVWCWLHRRRRDAAIVAIASLAFLPLQWMRGYRWGGTVEMNDANAITHDALLQWMIGFARSSYTFLKTTFWLGEWSFFRAPLWVLAIALAYVFAVALSSRVRRVSAPHVAALAVAAAATAAFFISHRRYWGQWGGVGGWYAWGWLPWLTTAFEESVEVKRPRALVIAGVAVALIANVAWFVAAQRVYG